MWLESGVEVPGRLIVVSGPSGCGKSTVIRSLLDLLERSDSRLSWPEMKLKLSVSATTRQPRPSERDGVDYFYMSQEEFDGSVGRGEFLEWAEYNGRRYGTPKQPVIEALAAGWNVMLEIEVQGAQQVRHILPSALFVFVKAPSFAVMEGRLVGRGTEPPAEVFKRLARAREELAQAHWYDVQIINEHVERAALDLVDAIADYG
jgi:guanylate kinase